MFEVPEWAECSAGSVSDLPACHRSVTRMVNIMCTREEDREVDFHSLGSCNRHVEVVEAHMAELSDLDPITVTRSEFPHFMLGLVHSCNDED